MAKKHFILQGKGGVGKSFTAAMLAQHKQSKKQPCRYFDTDPINATFHGYAALNVEKIPIMDGDEINSRNFDSLIEKIIATKEDVIVDNGASSFVPLAHYLVSNKIPTLLHEQGDQFIVHTVITGGQALLDTVNGFAELIRQMPSEAIFVVWLNPFWGAIAHEGKNFEELKAYKENKERVTAIINIPALKAETFGRDLSEMLQARLTFEEALALPPLTIMTRQRLKIVRDQLFAQLDQAAIL